MTGSCVECDGACTVCTLNQIQATHRRHEATTESAGWEKARLRFGVSWRQGHRTGYHNALHFILTTVTPETREHIIQDLTKGQA